MASNGPVLKHSYEVSPIDKNGRNDLQKKD